ncbi:UDP-glycosyltransferase 92A1 [Vigna unguiculata]|uniref:Glycosyltransferase n=1 Tax=Vigna unguiculata TaxID=3917 RepID=A0A4D6N9J1_VIGUN|nr:UDP-glycosyltransferase 92A1 [Vigna unguiculata]QCE09159.1 UDP-glucosyl transferase 73C [Vigna unguiculata]
MAEEKEEVLLFPFMAQGHIIPFLALALHLEKTQKYHITIVNTSLNIRKLRSSLPPNSSITLSEIPFTPSQHGLPPNTENTDAIPYNLVIRLIQASTTLKPAFTNLLRSILVQNKNRKLLVIADIFFGWTAAVAKELGAFHVIFSGCGGYGLACYYSLWLNLPHRRVDPAQEYFTLPDFPEARDIHRTQLPNNIAEADGSDAWSLFQQKNLSGWVDSDGVLFNTVREFDSVGLGYFKRKLNRPVWAIGPILFAGSGSRGKGGGINPKLCTEWLDAKPFKSVIFVCFGSMNTISASQMMELGKALERCGKSFIWVVRPPIGFDINSEFREDEWLPEGFVERVRESGKGLVVRDWAPQLEILSHSAVSVFLSHCGWNSVLESLSQGVPILGWPMAAEQFFNCKLLEEEVGVCVEVARGKSCEVKCEDIAEKIGLVMEETEKGVAMRKKAGYVRDMIRDAVKDEDGFKGSSVKAMDEFLSAALS